jgi:hypothetical protein
VAHGLQTRASGGRFKDFKSPPLPLARICNPCVPAERFKVFKVFKVFKDFKDLKSPVKGALLSNLNRDFKPC